MFPGGQKSPVENNGFRGTISDLPAVLTKDLTAPSGSDAFLNMRIVNSGEVENEKVLFSNALLYLIVHPLVHSSPLMSDVETAAARWHCQYSAWNLGSSSES